MGRKNIQLEPDISEWLKKHYSGTSLWWLVNALLREFMDLHRNNPPEFHDRIKQAAANIKEDSSS